MNKALVFFVSVLFVLFVFGSDEVLHVGQAAMLYSIFIVVLDYLRDRNFRLIHVWHFAFLYIIASEMVVSADLIGHHPHGLLACVYLLAGNLLFYFGYLFVSSGVLRKSVFKTQKSESFGVSRPRGGAFYSLLFFSFVFIFYAAPLAFSTLSSGRVTDSSVRSVDNLILDNFMLSVGLVLPALISQFFGFSNDGLIKRWILRLICLLIFLIFLLLGTRYYVLFCLGGYIIVSNKDMLFRLNIKRLSLILSLVVSMAVVLNAVKDIRVGGLSGDFEGSQKTEYSTLIANVASMLSPEGVVKLNADAIDYFERHDHLCGMSSGFLFYFWIPRAIWPEKPKMIGYWLIREYEDGFSDGHSASVGFFGDLYADFYIFVFPALFCLGAGLGRIEAAVLRALKGNGKNLVVAAMAYPAVFFFVRSPITTLVNFIGMYLAFKIVASFLYRFSRSK